MENYKINVMSAFEYDRLIAEVKFVNKDVGFILSQEIEDGEYEITIHSLVDNSKYEFVDLIKNPNTTLELDSFLRAVSEAKRRLLQLDKPKL
ncbi:MAG: hypothetical protein GY743_04340 [Planctomycetaceae bacterium]|nr:hypothetical protein [Planctomycetaceae bacterium]